LSKQIIHLSPEGVVLDKEPATSYTEFVAEDYVGTVSPVIVDSSVQPVYVTRETEDSVLTQEINPLTEQFLGGTRYGLFALNETVVQSCMTPEIVNNYTDTQFVPTISTIGVCADIGRGVAHFKGTYLDNPSTKAAGLKLPPFSTSNANTPYFLIKGWVYDFSQISAYDPIIVTRSADGVTPSTNDSFLIEFDNSTKRFMLSYSTASYASAGWQGSVFVSPSTPDQGVWHQFAVAMVSAGGCAAIKTYWDGEFVAEATGLCGCFRNSTAPLMIGSGLCGDLPCRFYMDDFHVLAGTCSDALYEYKQFSSSAKATGPEYGQRDASSEYTVYYMSMNGPLGTSLFPVENKCRVTGRVSFTDTQSGPTGGSLGVSLIIREQEAPSYLGYSLFSGVCSGFSASGVLGQSAGYVFGYESGSCLVVDSVNQLKSFSQVQGCRKSAVDFAKTVAYGVCAMIGACADYGDFQFLFGGGWSAGRTFTYLATQENLDTLNSLYENIVVTGYSGPTIISDHSETPYGFLTVDVQNLYKDVVRYRTDIQYTASSVKSAIQGSSLSNNLLSIKGFSSQGFAFKIAPYSQFAGSVLVDPVIAITKKTTKPQQFKVSGLFDVDPVKG